MLIDMIITLPCLHFYISGIFCEVGERLGLLFASLKTFFLVKNGYMHTLLLMVLQ